MLNEVKELEHSLYSISQSLSSLCIIIMHDLLWLYSHRLLSSVQFNANEPQLVTTNLVHTRFKYTIITSISSNNYIYTLH